MKLEEFLNKYFFYLPPDLISPLKDKILEQPQGNREQIVAEFGLDYEKIEDLFIKVSKERNKLAKGDGFDNYIKFRADEVGLPSRELEYFYKNNDRYIRKIYKLLAENNLAPHFEYSEYDTPCFICSIDQSAFEKTNNLENAKEYMFDKYNSLKQIKNKIIIKESTNSNCLYDEDKDKFVVNINTLINKRHQALSVVHELSHIIVMLNELNLTKYENEKKTIDIALQTLKDINEELYIAYLGNSLNTIHQNIFETDLYKNPDQDISMLYINIFNSTFNTSLKDNLYYLLQEDIILRPLSSFHHAVAYVNLLINKKNIHGGV